MSFAETYSYERLETRRIRSQRARFWAKVVSLLLMLTLGAVFYTEPQLRQSLMQAGMQGVMTLTGRNATPAQAPDSGNVANLQQLLQQAQGSTPAPAPEPGVRVNRYGPETSTRPQFQRVRGSEPAAAPAPSDSTAMAEQIGKLLERFQAGQ